MPPYIYFYSTVKLAGWKKGLIAVFCILLILAVTLVIAFKRRLLLFKRKRTGELSVYVTFLTFLTKISVLKGK